MKELGILFQNKRTLLGMVFLGVLVYTSFNIQESSGKLRKITNFESGMQTCFSRVNQTYTAKLLDDAKSQYLTQNFEALTEECFAESILNIDENFKFELGSITKKLSTLASNVHWFHEDLLAPQGQKSLANGEGRDIGSRFEKIENTKEEVLEESDAFKSGISNQLNNAKNIFYVSATLLIVIMLLEYLSNTKRKISNNAREVEAAKELLDNDGIESVKVVEIVRMALEQNELINCAKLFANFHLQNAFDKNVKNKNKNNLESLIAPTVTTSFKPELKNAIDEKIEKIWKDDSVGLEVDKGMMKPNLEFSLDLICSNVVDLLAEKMFSLGVQIDLNINENIMIKGTDEELEQIIYHAFSFAINSSTQSDAQRKVQVNAIKLGDVVAFDLISYGKGFEQEVLRNKSTIDSVLDIDLQICQSLLSGVQARMQLDNNLSQTGETLGARIKIIFKSSDLAIGTRLVDLKMGSKKEILAQMQQSGSN